MYTKDLSEFIKTLMRLNKNLMNLEKFIFE